LAVVYHITIKFPCEEEKKDTELICTRTIHYSDVDMPFEQRKVALAATFPDSYWFSKLHYKTRQKPPWQAKLIHGLFEDVVW